MGGMLMRLGAKLGIGMFGTWAGVGGQLGTQKCPRRRKGHLGLYFANVSLGWQFCDGSASRVFMDSSSPKVGCHWEITPLTGSVSGMLDLCGMGSAEEVV